MYMIRTCMSDTLTVEYKTKQFSFGRETTSEMNTSEPIEFKPDFKTMTNESWLIQQKSDIYTINNTTHRYSLQGFSKLI